MSTDAIATFLAALVWAGSPAQTAAPPSAGAAKLCWPEVVDQVAKQLHEARLLCQRPESNESFLGPHACALFSKAPAPVTLQMFAVGGPLTRSDNPGISKFTVRFFWKEGDIVFEVWGDWTPGEAVPGGPKKYQCQLVTGVQRPGPLQVKEMFEQPPHIVFDYSQGMGRPEQRVSITEEVQQEEPDGGRGAEQTDGGTDAGSKAERNKDGGR